MIKKVMLILASYVVVVLVLFALLIFAWVTEETEIYTTTNIADYGKIVGNYDNVTAAKFIKSFFPPSIDDCFSNVDYYYKAQTGDAVSCEANLRFSIEDEEQFDAYYRSLKKFGLSKAFPYDDQYVVWVVNDAYALNPNAELATFIGIAYAKTGLILCDKANSRFEYVAIVVWDGGGTRVDDLSHFFTRFSIDPVEYARSIDSAD